MPNPRWHGALLSDRCWYVVGWLMAVGITLGLLLLVDFPRWLHGTGRWGILRTRFRRAYGSSVAVGS